jgi:nucleoside-diphosphate-sugar epimerase
VTTVLVTGAGGFIGSRLCGRLRAAGHRVIGGVRGPGQAPVAAGSCVRIDDIAGFKEWRAALAGVDAVVHLAARAHCVRRGEAARMDEFRRINVAASTELFRASRDCGVRRFLFVSSIGVHGARTDTQPFRETDPLRPTEPYTQSKAEAEHALRALAAEGGSELVIVRPALVYGPGAKGNFLRLMRLVAAGWPLPFASIGARRNYLGLDNLCALLELCALDARAAGETFVAADPWSVDLPTVLRILAESMGRQLRLWPVHPALLRATGRLVGLSAEVARLTSSLEVDSGKACGLLQWRPGVAFREEMDNMVRAFVDARGRCS